jgi:lactoylglutathione lyase
MRIEHVAVWCHDIEAVGRFYARWFGAVIGERYENSAKGFTSRFVEFPAGARLELMSRTDITARAPETMLGYAHLAIAVGSEQAVDDTAAAMQAAGVSLIDGPRRTGDGYYEAVVLDPEGNRVEIAS